MAKGARGQQTSSGTAAQQPARGTSSSTRDSDARTTDAWLAAVVFGTTEAKVPVNIRLDADVVRYFRAGGPGYQTRINEVLKAFVAARLKAGDIPGAALKSRNNGRKRKRA
jgi:uncharacterized protein (DUF4415 family)